MVSRFPFVVAENFVYFPFIIKYGEKDALRIFHMIVGLIIMLSIIIAWLINPDIG